MRGSFTYLWCICISVLCFFLSFKGRAHPNIFIVDFKSRTIPKLFFGWSSRKRGVSSATSGLPGPCALSNSHRRRFCYRGKMKMILWFHTECPRSNDPFYAVSYFIKMVTTFWTYSMSNKFMTIPKWTYLL